MKQPFLPKYLDFISSSGLENESSGFSLRQLITTLLDRLIRDDDSFLMRMSTHVVVVILVFAAIGIGNLDGFKLSWNRAILPLKQSFATEPDPAPQPQPDAQDEVEALVLSDELTTQDDVVVRAAVPHTIIPDRTKVEIKIYVAEFGDTVYDIALRFNLAPETILWSNPSLADTPDLLRAGQELVIITVDGVYHQVGGDDTIEGIASTYKVEPTEIINYELN